MSSISHALNIASIAAVAGVGLLILQTLYVILYSPLRSVPGPFYSLFTSLPYKWFALRGQRAQFIDSLHAKYGSAVRILPDEVSISDLPAVKEIHRITSPYLKTNWYSKLAQGQAPNLFTALDPHAHRAMRALLAQPLSESALKTVEDQVTVNIQKTVDGMSTENSANGNVDILKWFTYMATDIIGELSFGESFRMLDQVKPNQYFHDLQNVGIMGQWRVELGGLCYLFGFLGINPFKQAVEINGRLTSYTLESFGRYERGVREDPENVKKTLFTKFITKQAEGVMSRTDMIRNGTAYIVAGSDTTAITSTYLIYHVCKHPAVRQKLIAELATLPTDFSWADLRDLPYLNRVIDETLRLCTAAPGSLKRLVPAGGSVLAGYQLPAGSTVSTQAYTLSRDPTVWEKPDEFNPDRWIDPTPDMKAAFMPFGGGSRVCIGLHLARDEMRYATAKFLRRFPKVEIVESDEGMEQRGYFLIAPKARRCLVALGEEVESEKM